MRMTASWSGTLWTDRIQGCGAMIRARWQAPPLIVEARLSPTNLSSSLRTVSDSVARGGNRDGWSPRASQQGDLGASAASDARNGWKLKLVPPGPNDGRGQLESLGRNRLTPDAPYKACSGFTHVTACRIAQSPKATFVTRLRPAGCPAAPLVSCQHNRQLAGWNLPPLVNRALRPHSHFRGPLLPAFRAALPLLS